MEGGPEQSKAQREMKALWDLVNPNDKCWNQKFTDMSDYDRVFQRIMSVPNWRQNLKLVYLFQLMRARKHVYFCESSVPEDSVIIPDPTQYIPHPNTEGLSEQQRKLAILAHNFVTHQNYHQIRRAAYDQVYRQFKAIKNWKEKPVLVDLYKKVQACEAKRKQRMQQSDRSIVEGTEQIQRRRDRVKEIEEIINQARKNGQVQTEEAINYYLEKIHGLSSWWKEEKLRCEHKILISELRIPWAETARYLGVKNRRANQGQSASAFWAINRRERTIGAGLGCNLAK